MWESPKISISNRPDWLLVIVLDVRGFARLKFGATVILFDMTFRSEEVISSTTGGIDGTDDKTVNDVEVASAEFEVTSAVFEVLVTTRMLSMT